MLQRIQGCKGQRELEVELEGEKGVYGAEVKVTVRDSNPPVCSIGGVSVGGEREEVEEVLLPPTYFPRGSCCSRAPPSAGTYPPAVVGGKQVEVSSIHVLNPVLHC